MKLEIENLKGDGSFDEVIHLAVRESLLEEEMEDNCEISVTLCDDEYITSLNEEYMKRQGPTDVLSFPMLSFDEKRNIYEDSIEFNEENLMLGDIVISLERAAFQAEEYGHSMKREVGFLTVHSMLHLLGYDHMEDAEREEMQAKEKKILTAMNLPRE